VGADPAKAATCEALRRFPFDRRHPLPSWPILQSQQPQLVAEVSADVLRRMNPSQEHRRLMEDLAPASLMGVPLIAHGHLLGALTIASCRPERRYRPRDLKLLGALGQRAALALDNARLYRTTQRALQTRDDVLGVVAHDLRNPLGTIMLQASMLRRLEPELGPRAGRLGEVIERASRRMNRLIQDLLDTTRMETGALPIEPARVPTAQIVLGSEEAHKSLMASASLQLGVEMPQRLPDVWGDRDRLLQVFENLLGNAAKFTPAGGLVTLGARQGDKEIIFWVGDTGEGIAPADVPRLFDRFWQARKGERRGAGLGLAIAKGIVEAHGGRIWVETAPGQGSTFRFTVPLAQPPENGAGQAAA
jgi:signal transduction histidine kinase